MSRRTNDTALRGAGRSERSGAARGSWPLSRHAGGRSSGPCALHFGILAGTLAGTLAGACGGSHSPETAVLIHEAAPADAAPTAQAAPSAEEALVDPSGWLVDAAARTLPTFELEGSTWLQLADAPNFQHPLLPAELAERWTSSNARRQRPVPAELEGPVHETVTLLTTEGICVATLGPPIWLDRGECVDDAALAQKITGCEMERAPLGWVVGAPPADAIWAPVDLVATVSGCADDSAPHEHPDAGGGDDSSADATTDTTEDTETDAPGDTSTGIDLGGLLDTGRTDSGGGEDTGTESDTEVADTSEVDPTAGPMNGLFGPGIERIIVEFDYETGAAPETTGTLGLGRPFNTFAANAEALFGQHTRPIEFADTLAGMGEIPAQSQTSYTRDEILALSALHRDHTSTDTVRTFHVMWLDGLYADESGDREQVLGVSLGNTEIVAIFKPTVSRYGGSLESQVEQATLVHEFGHAVGLTNRGVPMVEDHHDAEHGAHCSNEDCIMYWTVDGPDVVSFLNAGSFGESPVLFGPECLADVDAAAAQ